MSLTPVWLTGRIQDHVDSRRAPTFRVPAPIQHFSPKIAATRGDDAQLPTVVSRPMIIAMVALLVREYDEAIAFYRDAFGFQVVEDTALASKRWVRLRADGGAELLLSRAVDEGQAAVVGRQAGGRVFLFVHTADFDGDLARMRAANVRFTEAPRTEAFGRVVVVLDLYGNRIDVIERASV